MTEEKQRDPSADLERGVIAGLIASPERVGELAEQLLPEHFASGPRRMVYEAIVDMDARGSEIDLPSLGAEIQQRLEKAGKSVSGIYTKIASLMSVTTTSSLLIHYAKQLRAKATLKEIKKDLGEKLHEAAGTPLDEERVLDLLQGVGEKVDSLSTRLTAARRTDLVADLDQAFQEMCSTERPPNGLYTGYAKMDEFVGGLLPGTLTIIAARPSVGKSAFAMSLVRNMATIKSQPHGGRACSLMFSLEMGRDSLVRRLMALESSVELHRIHKKYAAADTVELNRIQDGIERLKEMPLIFDDTPGIGPGYIRSRIRSLMRKQPIHCVVVDYLQIMQSKAKVESRALEVGSFSLELKRIAQEFQIPVVALSQLNRSVDSRDTGDRPCIPRLSDLRESGSLEQDADTVMFLWRKRLYREDADETEALGIIAKARDGRTGEFPLVGRGPYTRYEDPPLPEGILNSIAL